MIQHPEEYSRAQIREVQWEKLQSLWQTILPANPFWTAKYKTAGLGENSMQSWDDFQQIPFCTKAEIVADHTANLPYGTNLSFPVADYARMHQTSGTTGTPLRWLDTTRSWDWFMECWQQIYRLTGVTAEDRVFFPFSFGPFIGFWAAFEGAYRLGCLCLPGGGLTSSRRLAILEENAATVVCCTPTYALRLAEVAEQENFDLTGSSVRALIVAGEPGGNIPATRERIETAWGARVFDHWGMTEIGSLGIETADAPGALEILETECIAEILAPSTSEPVAEGELGELIITNLGRTGSPLIRYRTGDLVRAEPSATSRSLLRLKGGILGRSDDMVTIRGNNVFPSSVEAILRRFPEVVEFRITVTTKRAMNHLTIEYEPTPEHATRTDELTPKLSQAIKDALNFQAEVIPLPVDSLPRFELKGRRFFRES